MRLAVDTSTLVAEALRSRGRRLLAHSALDLVAAEEAWSEAEHELARRVALVATRQQLSIEAGRELADEVLRLMRACVRVVSGDVCAPHMVEATERMPRDRRDAPTVALALALQCGIWTADRDFFGCGVPVWATETLWMYVKRQGTARVEE